MTRPLIALTAALALALLAVPATAQIQDPGGLMPPCQPGQMPSQTAPCLPPPCPEGTQPSPEFPCAPPLCAEGQMPTPEAPCMLPGGFMPGPGPGPGGPYPGPYPGPNPGPYPGPNPGPYPGPGGEQCGPADGTASQKPGCAPGGPGMGPGPGGPAGPGAGMLNKVWRFNAESEAYNAATNILNITVTKIANLPKSMAAQDDEIVDQDAYVVFSATTKVYTKDGKRIPKEVKYDTLLDASDTVVVSGKMMPAAKWQKDEDDMPVTTIRAKRVTVTS